MKEPFIRPTELALVPVIEILAGKAYATQIADSGEDADPDLDLVDYYGDYTTENLSEGSGQISADEECSSRAFTSLLRIKRGDLVRVRASVGYCRGRSFNEFAVSQLVMDALAGQKLFQEVLARIVTAGKLQGPFHPKQRQLELLSALPALAAEAAGAPVRKKDQLKVYVAHLVKSFEAPHYMNAGLMNFAGLFRVVPKDLKKVIAAVEKHTDVVSWVQQEVVAEFIVNALRITPKYRQGIAWSQFDENNVEG